MFGGWNWDHGNTYVNVNRATNISVNNFDANRYRDGEWHFDPAHRGGVPYRTPAERDLYGQRRPDAAQREQFRGQLDGRGGDGIVARGTQTPHPEQRADRGALDGIDRGDRVNRDYDRGRSSWGDRGWDGNRGGGGWDRGGGFHGGGFRR